jgi:hypothetical protein
VKKACEDLNIKMHLIPAGMTEQLQPLDRKIFGQLKSYSRFLFRNRMKGEVVFDAERRRSKKDACQDMVYNFIHSSKKLKKLLGNGMHDIEVNSDEFLSHFSSESSCAFISQQSK